MITCPMEHVQSFFLRVSARCNLSCDYCYVFKHQDMSWKSYPPIMSKETVCLFANRLREYAAATGLKDVYITYHGGEPLLLGAPVLLDYTRSISHCLRDTAQVHFSLQTNGTLLTDEVLCVCDEWQIGISVSLDGPEDLHNKHRKKSDGTGSFAQTILGIERLRNRPHLLQGIIGVIDPHSEPGELLDFYSGANLYNLDLLLPDANYVQPPCHRNTHPDIYKDWLVAAFDSWFDGYQELSIRTYECIMRGLLGENPSSDSFGLGELTYLTIETDGSYHTTDIMKVAYENASALGVTLQNSTIADALQHKKVLAYNHLLSTETLPSKCKSCSVRDICGGGSLPHRYSPEGFDNPTIYCREMEAVITHVKIRLFDEIDKEFAESSSAQ